MPLILTLKSQNNFDNRKNETQINETQVDPFVRYVHAVFFATYELGDYDLYRLIILTVQMFFVTIFVLNLLISYIGESFNNVRENEKFVGCKERMNFVSEYLAKRHYLSLIYRFLNYRAKRKTTRKKPVRYLMFFKRVKMERRNSMIDNRRTELLAEIVSKKLLQDRKNLSTVSRNEEGNDRFPKRFKTEFEISC